MEAPRRDDQGAKLPPAERGRAKKKAMSLRALAELDAWLGQSRLQAAE
jgi:methylenetetrahydrofolate--tRNA-(uracil-5-)-methyltransferase